MSSFVNLGIWMNTQHTQSAAVIDRLLPNKHNSKMQWPHAARRQATKYLPQQKRTNNSPIAVTSSIRILTLGNVDVVPHESVTARIGRLDGGDGHGSQNS
jgi:hypothetical protein